MADLKDLGWDNAGGETSKRILEALKACHIQGHKRLEVNRDPTRRGLHHQVTCHLCGWTYHYDSSD